MSLLRIRRKIAPFDAALMSIGFARQLSPDIKRLAGQHQVTGSQRQWDNVEVEAMKPMVACISILSTPAVSGESFLFKASDALNLSSNYVLKTAQNARIAKEDLYRFYYMDELSNELPAEYKALVLKVQPKLDRDYRGLPFWEHLSLKLAYGVLNILDVSDINFAMAVFKLTVDYFNTNLDKFEKVIYEIEPSRGPRVNRRIYRPE